MRRLNRRNSICAGPVLALTLGGCNPCKSDPKSCEENTAPSAPEVVITPEHPLEGANDLSCTVVTESVDAEGDTVSYSFAWTRDGADAGAAETISGGDTVAGERFVCTVTPNDGTEDGEPGVASAQVVSAFQGWAEDEMSLDVAQWEFVGEELGDQLGYTTCTAGDVDGDQLDDIFMTSHRNDEGGGESAGKVYLFLGANFPEPGVVSAADADHIWVGTEAEEFVGHDTVRAGDVNGDGYGDLLIGSYLADLGQVDVGRLFLVYGSDLQEEGQIVDLMDSAVVFEGEAANDHMGHRVGGAGQDLDGDGLSDITAGAYLNDEGGENAGAGYVVFGSSMAHGTTVNMADADIKVLGEAPGDATGLFVKDAGDVDGDGLDEALWVSVFNTTGGELAGKAYLFSGSNLSGGESRRNMSESDHAFVGKPGDFCCVLSYAGDADGDGKSDLLFGAEQNSDNGEWAGSSYLVYASSLTDGGVFTLEDGADHQIRGDQVRGGAGEVLSFVGDIDTDGSDEILISSEHWGPNSAEENYGKVYLFFGDQLGDDVELSVDDASYTFSGVGPREFAGVHNCPAGDMNHDGRTDLLIGAPADFEANNEPGSVYLLLTE